MEYHKIINGNFHYYYSTDVLFQKAQDGTDTDKMRLADFVVDTNTNKFKKTRLLLGDLVAAYYTSPDRMMACHYGPEDDE